MDLTLEAGVFPLPIICAAANQLIARWRALRLLSVGIHGYHELGSRPSMAYL
jgi:hypothetical protein